MRQFKSVIALSAVVGAVGITSSAQAQTFATFNFFDNTRILYTNGNGSAVDTLGLATLSGTTVTPVTTALTVFRFQTANGAEVNGNGLTNFVANTTLTASSQTGAINGATGSQLFQSVSITFKNRDAFLAKNGIFYAANTANLLTLNVTGPTGATGNLTGLVDNNQTPNFGGTQSQGFVIGYSSDFLNFTGSVADKDYNIAVTSATNRANNTPGLVVNGNNALDFYGSFSGNFSATPLPLDPTPAPPGVVSGLIGIAMGGAQFGMVKFRKRRRAQKTEVAA